MILIYLIVGTIFLIILGLCIIERMLSNLKETLEALHDLSKNNLEE